VDLAKKTVCIKVRLSTMGNTRKVSTSQIEADADKDLLRVSKHLLPIAALQRVEERLQKFAADRQALVEAFANLHPNSATRPVEPLV
jgi:hypothetical protein